ncbi:hypothetical protein GCM10010399_61590 [Dactylosporangium fulvum]
MVPDGPEPLPRKLNAVCRRQKPRTSKPMHTASRSRVPAGRNGAPQPGHTSQTARHNRARRS